jgi:sulfur-oxidizing protein SoxA
MVKWLCASLLLICSPGSAGAESVTQTAPGIKYQSSDIQAMQADDFQNPGLLAVDEGERLASTPVGKANKACTDCHQSFSGEATEFPKFNSRLGKVVSLSSQIMSCRTQYQEASQQSYESESIQSLTAYVASESHGLPFAPVTEDDLRAAIDRGKKYYYERKGQLNLACHHCHEQNAGRLLRGDLISQGVSTGYPVYRLEWQSIGSLHRRFRSCDIGVRAEPALIGGQVYTDLEVYLRVRAGVLPITAPAVRR